MFDVDGALVGYGGLAPEPLIEMIAAGKAKDYAKARAHPRPAAAGDPHRLSPRLAHGRNGRAQARPRRARHPRARDRPLAVAAARAGRRGRDRRRDALGRSGQSGGPEVARALRRSANRRRARKRHCPRRSGIRSAAAASAAGASPKEQRKVMKTFKKSYRRGRPAILDLAPGQAYPDKVVRIGVPYPPGGTVDTVARMIAARLSESLVTSSSWTIGRERTARSAALRSPSRLPTADARRAGLDVRGEAVADGQRAVRHR